MTDNRLNLSMKWLFLFFVTILCGCSIHFDNFTIHKNWSTPVSKVPANLVVIANENLCSFTVTEKRSGDKLIFHVGQTICENAQDVFSLAFRRVQVVRNSNDVVEKNADFMVYMKIIDASVVSRSGIPVAIDSVVNLEWTLTDMDGKLLYVNTVNGVGQDVRTFGTLPTRQQASMEMCLNDLMRKLYEDMLTPAVRQIANSLSRTGGTTRP